MKMPMLGKNVAGDQAVDDQVDGQRPDDEPHPDDGYERGDARQDAEQDRRGYLQRGRRDQVQQVVGYDGDDGEEHDAQQVAEEDLLQVRVDALHVTREEALVLLDQVGEGLREPLLELVVVLEQGEGDEEDDEALEGDVGDGAAQGEEDGLDRRQRARIARQRPEPVLLGDVADVQVAARHVLLEPGNGRRQVRQRPGRHHARQALALDERHELGQADQQRIG